MREGWQQTTLGSLLQRKTTRLGDAKEPRILTVTEGHGLVDQLEHWGRRVATEDVSKYKVVEPNDVVYNVYLLWNGAIGQNLFGDRGVTSPVYEVFSPVMDVEPRLLGLILEEPKLREAFDSISIGTIPRRRRAPWQDFLALPVTLPPLDEQRRIVDLVGALDDAIEAAEQQIRTSEAAGIQARRHAFESVTDTASVAAAGDLFDMLLGRQKSARQTVGDHMIPYLRAANISSQGFLLEDVQTMNFSPPEQEKYGLRPRDVMLVEGGSLGQSSMWMGELGGAVGFDKHVIRLREVPGTSIAEYALQWTRWAYESGAFDASTLR